MNQTERLQLIMSTLRSKGAFARQEMIERFEISEPTFKRDLEFLRSRYGADITYDRMSKLYRLASREDLHGKYVAGERIELAGLWFGPDELQALLSMYALLDGVGAQDILGSHLAPFKARIEQMLGDGSQKAERVRQCIRILPMAARPMSPFFVQIAQLTLDGRRFEMRYHQRQRGESTLRIVSPQRLVYYRNNWYLDAYCHLRERLSTFALDAIEAVTPLKGRAKVVAEAKLDRVLAAGYGIFNGSVVDTAVLQFSSAVSPWVSKESWHPNQEGAWVNEGEWRLSFPYSHTRELVMDILRWGADVRVISPASLAQLVHEAHAKAAEAYTKPS